MRYILFILFGIIIYFYTNKLQKFTIGIPMNMEYLTTLKLYTASTEGLFNYTDLERIGDTFTNEDALKLVNVDKYAYPEAYGAYGGSEPATMEQLPNLLERVSHFLRPENFVLSISNKIKQNLPIEVCYLKDPSNEEIVGFCFVFFDYHLPMSQGMNINNVAVGGPKGQGICQYMIENVKNYLLEKYKQPDFDKPLTIGYEHLNSNTSKFNIASCKCYLKNGFRLINSQSNLGRRIIEYNGGHRDGVTSYSINYEDTIYNLIETNLYKTFLLVHMDSVSQYDNTGINQYYDLDDNTVCIERYSCSAKVVESEQSQGSYCVVM